MKKLIALALALVCVSGLVACDSKSGKDFDQPDDLCQFTATILEIHDDYFLVESKEGTEELNSGDKFEVPTQNADQSIEWQVGDRVLITYNGGVLDSLPMQLGQVYKIEKLTLTLTDDNE